MNFAKLDFSFSEYWVCERPEVTDELLRLFFSGWRSPFVAKIRFLDAEAQVLTIFGLPDGNLLNFQNNIRARVGRGDFSF